MENRDTAIAVRIITFIVFITFSLQVLAAPGDLDTSFNGTGIVTTGISGASDVINGVAVQTDGKIVVAGSTIIGSSLDFAVARYKPDGTLDTSFSMDGKLTTDFGGFDYALDVAIQTDGKIVAVGWSNSPAAHGFALARYNSDGSLDTSFNGTGRVVTTDTAEADSVAIQPDGKILVAGGRFIIGRYNTNGSLDTSFDGDGIVVTPLFGITFVANDIALQADGKIVVAGNSRIAAPNNEAFALVRYNANGSLDTSFDDDGTLTTDFGDFYDDAQDIVIQSDGKIVAAGSHVVSEAETRFALARYQTDGSLDPAFDTDGKVTTPFGVRGGAYAVTLQSDGKIVAAGGNYNGTSVHSAAIRYNTDASLDTSFGAGGKVSTQVGAESNFLDVTVQPDGNIVTGGTTANGLGSGEFLVVRYLGNAAAPRRSPFDFDGDSKTDIGIFRPGVAEWWINRSSNGTTFAAQFGATTDELAPGDYTGDGKADIAIWRPSSGEWFILRSEDSSFFSFPFGTTGDTPTPADYDADGKVDAAVFREPSATWYIRRSSDTGTTIESFGTNGDLPVVADYDGDGKSDIAIYRPSTGQWWIKRSTTGVIAFTFGVSTDKPVQGDYTGDGKSDVAFWRLSTGEWYVLRSEDFSYYSQPFGTSTDIPSPGDYDGDGKFDPTVFRPSNATWFSARSTAGTLIQQFGTTGDSPIPNAFVP